MMERVVQTGGILGVSGLPLEAPGGLGILLWSWRPQSTGWKGREAFCTMEKPEGRSGPDGWEG